MDADGDAWSAEIRRLPAPDPDPLTLDEDTAERLLAGDLGPDQASPGYAEVAALLAAVVAAPSPAELAGQEAALAELRAVARAPRARSRGVGKPGRRRRVGLVVAVAAAALSTGGIAAAATGKLPNPIRDAAWSIFATQGNATTIPATKPGRQPDPSAGTADGGAATSQGQGPRPAGEPGATAMTGAVEDDRCRASKAHKDIDKRKQMDAATSNAPAEATGGADKNATHCQRSQPDGTRTNGQGKQATPTTDSKPGRGQGGGPPSSSSGAGNPKPGKPPETGPHRR